MNLLAHRPLTGEESIEFADYAARAWKILGLIGSQTAPAEAVGAVNAWVDAYQAKSRGFLARFRKDDPQLVDYALGLGAVWGDQICREFGWKWVCVGAGNHERYGVASPAHSLVIYPTYFLKECLVDPRKDCTALLSFNMLAAQSVPALEAGALQDVMEGVARVIPKR